MQSHMHAHMRLNTQKNKCQFRKKKDILEATNFLKQVITSAMIKLHKGRAVLTSKETQCKLNAMESLQVTATR